MMVVGRSGAGKTTLALALVRPGLGMLSDELALSAPDTERFFPTIAAFTSDRGLPSGSRNCRSSQSARSTL